MGSLEFLFVVTDEEQTKNITLTTDFVLLRGTFLQVLKGILAKNTRLSQMLLKALKGAQGAHWASWTVYPPSPSREAMPIRGWTSTVDLIFAPSGNLETGVVFIKTHPLKASKYMDEIFDHHRA